MNKKITTKYNSISALEFELAPALAFVLLPVFRTCNTIKLRKKSQFAIPNVCMNKFPVPVLLFQCYCKLKIFDSMDGNFIWNYCERNAIIFAINGEIDTRILDHSCRSPKISTYSYSLKIWQYNDLQYRIFFKSTREPAENENSSFIECTKFLLCCIQRSSPYLILLFLCLCIGFKICFFVCFCDWCKISTFQRMKHIEEKENEEEKKKKQ